MYAQYGETLEFRDEIGRVVNFAPGQSPRYWAPHVTLSFCDSSTVYLDLARQPSAVETDSTALALAIPALRCLYRKRNNPHSHQRDFQLSRRHEQCARNRNAMDLDRRSARLDSCGAGTARRRFGGISEGRGRQRDLVEELRGQHDVEAVAVAFDPQPFCIRNHFVHVRIVAERNEQRDQQRRRRLVWKDWKSGTGIA